MNKEIMNKSEKIRTNFAKIIVSGTCEKPYYEIMYFDHPKNEMCIGYSSYNLEYVFQCLEDIFEVVEEKEEPMENQKTPRICEVLGGKDNSLEVYEEFDVRGFEGIGPFCINGDGQMVYEQDGADVVSDDAVYVAVNHPGRIIRKPRFTEDEITFARYFQSGCMTNAAIERTEGNYLIWKSEDTEEDKMEHLLPYKLFPSIRPGQSVSIKDIVGYGNE